MSTLHDFLNSHGFLAAANAPLDGSIFRFDRGGEQNGWFLGRRLQNGAVVALCGDWKTGKVHRFQGEGAGDASAVAELQAMEAKEKEERQATQEEVAKACLKEWGDAITLGRTPYLDKKGLAHLHGARICPRYTDTLLVPALGVGGGIWSIQRILPDGTKRFAKGGRKQGCFFRVGVQVLSGGETIYICEGFSTGASIYEALGPNSVVVCAFDAGNLIHVGKALRAKFPEAKLVFCADNDRYGEVNKGVDCARAAAEACRGEIRVPQFQDQINKYTDFNDLHLSEGLAEVKKQLLNPPMEEGAGIGVANGGLALPKGKSKKPKFSEKMVAQWMLESLDGSVIRQDKALFQYDGLKWDELDSTGVDLLKNRIVEICRQDLDSGQVDSFYRTFVRYLPVLDPKKHNLFQPRPDLCNFKNGTLHLKYWPKTPEEMKEAPGGGTSHFSMEFKPHAKEDFCTQVIPMDYKPLEELPVNQEFEEMLRRVWPDSDPHQGEKIASYKELLGASLIPLFPKIFFLLGEAQCGKSTLLTLPRKLLGDENVVGIDPHKFSTEFGLWPLVNKLANIHPDISTTKLLDDSVMKSIIDGVPVSVNRKQKSFVDARLPALHAYGCNDMPRSLSGGSQVYGRRAIILRTETRQAGFGGGGEFSNWVWQQGPGGILRAALEGLTRLLSQGGKYTIPVSSKEEVQEWDLESDLVGQFLEAVEHGEIVSGGQTLLVGHEEKISKASLYRLFIRYSEERSPESFLPSDKAFTKRMRQEKRFGEHRTKHSRSWLGIGGLEKEVEGKY